ncbi:hypothetical protein [Fimbriiglobus ruber]|uniref:Uncharacterized protein n=1 Tax=Fimbriiglobus ruber TaxID=1908690 RepID=A0A225DCZ4_9BACT|nr:hypothetical protein [Fimbriiglobus ruber]OWK34275.1 hypothetical protein FRUB_10246 [Fimbriiglobus ruber]
MAVEYDTSFVCGGTYEDGVIYVDPNGNAIDLTGWKATLTAIAPCGGGTVFTLSTETDPPTIATLGSTGAINWTVAQATTWGIQTGGLLAAGQTCVVLTYQLNIYNPSLNTIDPLGTATPLAYGSMTAFRGRIAPP